MNQKINTVIDWFETHFNYLIELLALIGGLFCILFAILLFLINMFDPTVLSEARFEIIVLPGVIGFFGVIILFALRITRHLTIKKD